MHVVTRIPNRQRRRKVDYGREMYSPAQRGLVRRNVGYIQYEESDGLEGMFNIGKMFTRMFTFTPRSFQLKNIAGAIGSAVTTIGTGGLANVASEFAGPSGLKLTKGTITGAHSTPMKVVGYGTMAAAAAAAVYFGGGAALTAVKGAGGVAASSGTGLATAAKVPAGATIIGSWGGGAVTTSSGIMGTIGSTLSTIGSGLMTGIKAIGSVLPVLGGVMGGGGGGSQQQQGEGETADQYYERQRQEMEQARIRQAEQDIYNAQVAAEQAAMYMPAGYSGGFAQQPSMNNSYGDLRSPYTAITEDGQQVQVDPTTGEVIQPGMSTEVMIGIAALALAGGIWYMSGSEKTN